MVMDASPARVVLEYLGHEPGVSRGYFTGAVVTRQAGEEFVIDGTLAAAIAPIGPLQHKKLRKVLGLEGCEAAAVVGRRERASWRIASSVVAPYHALFGVVSGRLLVVDLGSTNGTVVDGESLEPMVPYLVPEGAVVTLAGGFYLKHAGVVSPTADEPD